MPYRVRASNECRQFCRSSSICGSFFATIWCINMLVSAVTSLKYANQYFDEWIEVDAEIVGRNSILNLTSEDQGKQSWLDDNATHATDGMNDIVFLDDISNQTDAETDADTDINQTKSNNTDLNQVQRNDTGSNNNLENNTIDNEVKDNYTNHPTDAPISPPITPGIGGRLVYCAEVEFQIDGNLYMTTVSDTYCSYEPSEIVIGNTFVVLYNPANPEEIIEESLYVHTSNSLRVTVAVTVLFTVMYLLCSLYLYRSQPGIARAILSHPGQDLDSQDANPNDKGH